ncbi:hemagglutinin/amebocyte aggregation factor-like [Haliotis rufescens]|uniref:hemagglutinin/amebocyte aggregation factor-like n=1 Tax=Haliotis rufescens TaxID=6454 RepID=UPI001EAFD2C9|nr:hemagglutinin/amebocyte aggregation factor-like [Haliotis rufescens]
MESLRKIILWALVCHVTAWVNQFDQAFNFTCPPETSLSHVVSSHDNHFEDRVWDFSCRAPPYTSTNMSNCEWTDYENDFDQPLTFQCASDGIIAGISSIHDNHYEDRRFKFYCCEISGFITGSCYFTAYVNKFDEHMDYVVPSGKVMRGIDSYHENKEEDRRFKFEICDLDEHDTPIEGELSWV